MITNILVVMTPFVQLGTSYYRSVGMVMLLLSISNWARVLITGANRSWPFALCAAAMLMAPLLNGSPTNDFLRCAREASLFVLLMFALVGFRGSRVIKPPKMTIVVGTVGALLCLVVVQTFALQRGTYIGPPREMYAAGLDTITDELALIYGAGDLRPAATFAEPSYLAFVLLSFSLAVFPALGFDKRARIALGMIMVTGLLSRSLAFVLAAILVLVVPALLIKSRSEAKLNRATGSRKGLLLPGVAVVAMLFFTNANRILERLGNATSSSAVDVSTSARILAPTAALPGFLLSHPLGVPFSNALTAVRSFVPGWLQNEVFSLDNGLFNLFFIYGLPGFLVVAALYFAAGEWRIRLYLICCMMFNGSFLSLDKVSIIIIALSLYHGGQRSRESNGAAA